MILGLLRIKNEARWIADVLRSLTPLCDRILVMDDHSTDGTPDICRSIDGAIDVLDSPFTGLDETRDKNWLLGQAAALNPAWCLMIDGDELLEPRGPDIIRQSIAGGGDCFCLRVAYLWDAPDQVRVDGVYGKFARPSLFRFRPGLRFSAGGSAAHFHCGNAPREYHGRSRACAARLLHLGYMDRADRLRKYAWYNEQDPGNRTEDCYRHMVIGDIFPVESRFRYAGPLDLRTI